MHIRRKLNSLGAFGIALAIAVPVGTVALTAATQAPASATLVKVFCTSPTTGAPAPGYVTFQNAGAPQGLTEQGYFQATNAQTSTGVHDTTVGTCHTGTDDTDTPLLGTSTAVVPSSINSTPCEANTGDPANPPVECDAASSFKGTVTSGSPELDLTTASVVQSGTSPPVTPFQQINFGDVVDMSATAQNSNWSTTGVTVSSTCGDGGITGEPCAGTTPGTSYIDFSNNFNASGTVTVILYTAVQLPGVDTAMYWYGSGGAFASGGTSSIINSIHDIQVNVHYLTATGPLHVLDFVTEQSAEVTTPTAGFEIYGYTLDCGVGGTISGTSPYGCATTGTGHGYYNDPTGATTCTPTSALTACPSKTVALLKTDTGTHANATATTSGIQNFTMKKGTAANKLVLTVANTNAWPYVKACSTNCFVTDGAFIPAGDYITAVAGTGAANTSIITLHANTTVSTTPRAVGVQLSDFLKDIGAIETYPPATAHATSDNAVQIDTTLLDNGTQVTSVGAITHSYFQS